jgi:hypothetical protein
MNFQELWVVAEQARGRGSLSSDHIAFVRDTVPSAFDAFPRIALPKMIRRPGGFTVSGAPVGTVVRSALLMRSHFHHGHPKGTYCCVQGTLAVYPVLEARAIRYFDCALLSAHVRQIVRTRRWRFARTVNAAMLDWSLGA